MTQWYERSYLHRGDFSNELKIIPEKHESGSYFLVYNFLSSLGHIILVFYSQSGVGRAYATLGLNNLEYSGHNADLGMAVSPSRASEDYFLGILPESLRNKSVLFTYHSAKPLNLLCGHTAYLNRKLELELTWVGNWQKWKGGGCKREEEMCSLIPLSELPLLVMQSGSCRYRNQIL